MIPIYSLIHTILIALYVTACTSFSTTVMASPLPRQATHLDSLALSTRKPTSVRPLSQSMRIARNLAAVPGPSKTPIFAQVQSNQTMSPHAPPASHYAQFMQYYKAAKENSRQIKKCAAQSSSLKDDTRLQEKCMVQLNSFKNNVQGQQVALSALTADKRNPGKGLDNYDKTNDIEKLIKDTVNLNKNTLKAIYVMVNNTPVLGPILGPIVYEVKCLLDDILNYCEAFLDGTINTLQPVLKALLGSKPTPECPGGVMLLGLCI